MKVQVTEKSGIAVVRVIGHMAQEESSRFRVELESVLEKGINRIVVDMSELNYLTSLALSAIVNAGRKVRVAKGAIAVAAPNPVIRKLFDITNLSKTIPVFATLENAMQSFVS